MQTFDVATHDNCETSVFHMKVIFHQQDDVEMTSNTGQNREILSWVPACILQKYRFIGFLYFNYIFKFSLNNFPSDI